MDKIQVVVVDDNEVDRYIVKRRLAKVEAFGQVDEIHTGDEFLEKSRSSGSRINSQDRPLLVLMDINMPGRNGLETVEELQRQIASGKTSDGIVVLMFTSSNNPKDIAHAKTLEAVKGYIPKPLDGEGVDKIIAILQDG